MKKIFSFFVALMATMMLFAQDAYKVTWVTNGVEMPTAPTSNEDLWKAFMPAYNAYYGLSRGEQPITAVATFASAKMQEFMTDENSDWKWLGDYILAVVKAANFNNGDLTSEVLWRFNVQAFFNCKEAASSTWNGNPDFTEAGKFDKWIGAWKKANALPETMTASDPMPILEREGYTFIGWFDNEACTGSAIQKVTKDITLYAGWERTVYNVTFVAPFAYPNDMYVDDVYELAYALQKDYNAAYNTSKAWAKMEDGQVYFHIGEEWKLPAEAQGQGADVANFIQAVTYNTTDNLKKIVEAENSKWAWLKPAIEASRTASEMTGDISEGLYRKEISGMFLASPIHTGWPKSSDWTKYNADSIAKAWGGVVSLPDTIEEDYTLPVMYRENYEFKGWYWSEDFSGDEVKVVPVKSNGTLYAKFEATDKALLGIALDKKDTVELQMPNTDQLTVIYTPETAVNKKVVWSSSDENVLVVDQNGLVTPMAPGKATIKVVSDESKLEASVVYNITAAPGAVTGVTLDQTKVTLDMGKTIQLVATIAPDTAINKKVIWTSDGKAASVDENGLVKADTIGTATITVTTEDGGYTATCVVTVPEPLDDIVVEKLWEVAIPSTVANIGDVRNGMGWNGKFYLTDKKQNKIRVFSQAGEDADAAIPMAEGANLGTGIAIDDAGNIIVNANFPSADTCVYIVKNGETKMTKIDFASMGGRCDHITAFGDVFSEEGGLVFFYAQNKGPQYVKISKGEFVKKDTIKGTFTHSSQGQAQIIYGTETECIASQRGSFEHMVDGILVPHDAKNIVLNDVGGAVMNIGGENVWAYKVGNNGGKAHSSEFSIRNVTTHRFVADKNGETVQYVIDNKQDASGNSCGIFAKAEKINEYAYYLNVFSSPKGAAVYKVYKNVPVESIALDKTAEAVKAGDKLQLTATITPAYATVQDVEWSTSDSAIAIVDQNGLVQAIAAGEATITATTTDGSKLSATCALTVKAVLYKKATSVEQLIAGKKMLIVNGDSITMAEARTNNFGSVAVTPNEDGVIDNVPAEATVITLEKDSVFSFAIDGGYITAGTSKSNNLKVDKERTSLTGWDITIAENGAAGIVCHDPESERNTIRFNKNNGNPIFSAYKAENKMEDVAIYIEFEPVTYNVTVPAGTNTCYIVGAMTDSWTQFVEMEMVDATHYTITLDNAAKTDEYKYTCGPDWKYVEKNADGSERGNRTWAEQDVVEAWAEIYNAVEDIRIDANTIEKVIIDGNLYIIRGGKMYNTNGAVVR